MRQLLAAIITIASFNPAPSFAQAPGQSSACRARSSRLTHRVVSGSAARADPGRLHVSGTDCGRVALGGFPTIIIWSGEPLARAIADDHLPMDPSVQALLPFPSVLHMMAADMPWTSSLGNAFLDQPQDVTDAAQRLRLQARDYGYLRTNTQVTGGAAGRTSRDSSRGAQLCGGALLHDPGSWCSRRRIRVIIVRWSRSAGAGYSVPIRRHHFHPWGWGGNRIVWTMNTTP